MVFLLVQLPWHRWVSVITHSLAAADSIPDVEAVASAELLPFAVLVDGFTRLSPLPAVPLPVAA